MVKWTAALRRYWQDDFWRQSVIFTAGSIAVGALNYLYYPALARLLTVDAFGEVQAIFSILLNAGIIFSTLSIVITNLTINSRDRNDSNSLISQLQSLLIMVILILAAASLLLVRQLADFLQMDSTLPLTGMIVAIVLTLFTSVRQAFMQGRKDFGGASIGSLAAAAGKLVSSVALVVAGFGVAGAIGGLILGQLAALIYIVWRSKQLGLRLKFIPVNRLDWQRLLPQLKYGLMVLITSLSITLLYSGDIIAVKHYFNPTLAGEYAGIATIARIIFFITAPIATVMFASIKLGADPAGNWRLLRRSLGFVGVFSAGFVTVLYLAPNLVIRLLVGEQYLAQAGYLGQLALALAMVSVLNLLFFYQLALRRWSAAVISAIGAASTLYLIIIRHNHISEVIENIIFGTILMVTLMAAWNIYSQKRGSRYYK